MISKVLVALCSLAANFQSEPYYYHIEYQITDEKYVLQKRAYDLLDQSGGGITQIKSVSFFDHPPYSAEFMRVNHVDKVLCARISYSVRDKKFLNQKAAFLFDKNKIPYLILYDEAGKLTATQFCPD